MFPLFYKQVALELARENGPLELAGGSGAVTLGT